MRLIIFFGLVLFLATSQTCYSGNTCAVSAHSHYQQQSYATYNDVTIIGVPIAPYYYSVGEDPDEQADRIARKIVEIQKEKSCCPPKEEVKAAAPNKRDRFKLIGESFSAKNLDNSVASIFNQSCVQCHKPGASKPGNIQILATDRKLYINPDVAKESSRRERIVAAVESGEMPKGSSPLSAAKKKILREWADEMKGKQ
jgi:uncharacterized membrane protein